MSCSHIPRIIDELSFNSMEERDATDGISIHGDNFSEIYILRTIVSIVYVHWEKN